jgi:nucleoside-diphosphate-sugar epimerase
VQRLIYTSTIAAYYLGGRRPITETSSLDPGEKRRNHYARAKIISERALRDFERLHGLEVVICRPGVVVGPGGLPLHSAIGTWPNPSHVVGWGSGRLPVPLVLVQDCADALARLVEISQLDLTSFNLVGETTITPREYVRALAAATGRRIAYHPMPISVTYATDLAKWVIKVLIRRPGTVFPSWRDLATRSQRAPFDISATKRVLQWQPDRDPESVIARGIGYLRRNPCNADQLRLVRMHSVEE